MKDELDIEYDRLVNESSNSVFYGIKGSAIVGKNPEVKTFICPKHGEFQSEVSQFFERWYHKTCCPECSKEHNQNVINAGIERDKLQHAKRIKAKILRSGVSKRNIGKSFDTYKAETREQQKALESCKLIADSVIQGGITPNLIMIGSVGTGKTHLASSIAVKCIRAGKRVATYRVIELLRSLKSTWRKDSEDTEQDILHYVTNLDLLILDEVGVQFESDTEKLFIFDIINGRYDNELPTVLISNLDMEGVSRAMGERVIDRLREDGGTVVPMNWQSFRGQQ